MGSHRLFQELYQAYRKGLLSTAYRILKDWDLAEDVVQETFMALLQELESGKHIETPKAYLNTIATHAALKAQQSRGKSGAPTDFELLEDLLYQSGRTTTQPSLESMVEWFGSEETLSDVLYWVRKAVREALLGRERIQRARLREVLRSSTMTGAILALRPQGDDLQRSTLSQSLIRLGLDVQRCFEQLCVKGPGNRFEEQHWAFFLKVQETWKQQQQGTVNRTLFSWMLRSIQSFPENIRKEFVDKVFKKIP